jgi:hypothetical protein
VPDVFMNKNGGVAITQTDVFIIPLTTRFTPNRQSVGDF